MPVCACLCAGKVFGVEDNQALTKLRYPEHQRDRVSICPRPGAVESRRAAAHMGYEVPHSTAAATPSGL